MNETVNVVDIISQIRSNLITNIENMQQKSENSVEMPKKKIRYQGIVERVRNQKKIIIVGAGNYGKQLYEIFKRNGIENVVCFADNSAGNYVNGVFDKKVVSIDDAVKEHKDAYYIVTPKYYFMEIIRQINLFGISIDQIDCFLGF